MIWKLRVSVGESWAQLWCLWTVAHERMRKADGAVRQELCFFETKKHKMKFSQVCHSGLGVPQGRVERTWVERETDKDERGTRQALGWGQGRCHTGSRGVAWAWQDESVGPGVYMWWLRVPQHPTVFGVSQQISSIAFLVTNCVFYSWLFKCGRHQALVFSRPPTSLLFLPVISLPGLTTQTWTSPRLLFFLQGFSWGRMIA